MAVQCEFSCSPLQKKTNQNSALTLIVWVRDSAETKAAKSGVLLFPDFV